MRIAILGWGSLIWDPQNLKCHMRGCWKKGGPKLPLEFSRISKSRCGALTLVIDPKHGVCLPTRYILSTRTSVADAVKDLWCREKTKKKTIGVVDLRCGSEHSKVEKVREMINEWAVACKIDAVIWTDLSSNFQKRPEKPFSCESGIAYLKTLRGKAAKQARCYITKAPEEIKTPLRQALEKDGWLDRQENA